MGVTRVGGPRYFCCWPLKQTSGAGNRVQRLPGFNAAGSLAQVFRMRLSVSLQRSLAHAVHSHAGCALVAASGS
eukprot:SM008547S23313  [mRNA]  locus=s8547:336:554:- [translate_table: standard]